MIAASLLILFAVYLACGAVFAIPFALVGVGKIDPHAAHGSWGFRILIVPGTIMLWPLLARRWAQGFHEPPEERNAHRQRAEAGNSAPGTARPRFDVTGRLDSLLIFLRLL